MTKLKDLVEKYGNREIDEVELKKLLRPRTIYDLEVGDKYYHITERGTCDWVTWDNDDFDFKALSIGNVFLTQEEVKFEIEYLKVKTELKRYASMCEEPLDWNNYKEKHYLTYDYVTGEPYIAWNRKISHSDIFFTDKSILEQAIKEIGKERIVKYYLGVRGNH